MRQIILLLSVCAAIHGCGGGGSNDSRQFVSLAGRWQIEANDVIQANCPIQVGGLSDEIVIAINGETVTVTLNQVPSLIFTGTLINGGLLVAANLTDPDLGETHYSLSIENVPSTNDRGTARYSFEQVDVVGSVLCQFSVEGPADHISELAQGYQSSTP